ncbi:MAG: hypothetical protein MHMPM18_001422 [Marteilia pararefringens]
MFSYFSGTLQDFLLENRFDFTKKLEGKLHLNYWPLNSINYTELESFPYCAVMRRLLTPERFIRITNIPDEIPLDDLEEILEEEEKSELTISNKLRLQDYFNYLSANQHYIFSFQNPRVYILKKCADKTNLQFTPHRMDVFITPVQLILNNKSKKTIRINIEDLLIAYNSQVANTSYVFIMTATSNLELLVIELDDLNTSVHLCAALIDQAREFDMDIKNNIMINISSYFSYIKNQLELIHENRKECKAVGANHIFKILYRNNMQQEEIDTKKYTIKNIISYDMLCITLSVNDVNSLKSCAIKIIVKDYSNDFNDNRDGDQKNLEKQLLMLKILNGKYVPKVVSFNLDSQPLLILDIDSSTTLDLAKYIEKCRSTDLFKLYEIVINIMRICDFLKIKHIIQAHMSIQDFYITKAANVKLHNFTHANLTTCGIFYDKKKIIPIGPKSHPISITNSYFSHETDAWSACMISVQIVKPSHKFFKTVAAAHSFYLTSSPEDVDSKLKTSLAHNLLKPFMETMSYSTSINYASVIKRIKMMQSEIKINSEKSQNEPKVLANQTAMDKFKEVQDKINECQNTTKYKELEDLVQQLFSEYDDAMKSVILMHLKDKEKGLKTIDQIQELKKEAFGHLSDFNHNRFKASGKEYKNLTLNKLGVISSKIGVYKDLLE